MVSGNRRQTGGFTLIELMVTVTVLGILAAVAVPSYFEFVRESRREDATIALQEMLAQQALFYSNYGGSYTTTVSNLGFASFGDSSTFESKDGHYAITLDDCNDGTTLTECIAITADPESDSQKDDHECSSFTLNSRGAQQATKYIEGTGTISSVDDPSIREVCWK